MSHRESAIRILTVCFVLCLLGCVGSMAFLGMRVPETTNDKDPGVLPAVKRFSLQTGDILCRPNLSWLPGSSDVPCGRNFGHVVIVVKGAEDSTIEATLNKAVVCEAVVFDQTTRSLIRNPDDQVRETTAGVSFGKRFEGIRYRLRMNLPERQKVMLVSYLYKQLDQSHYDLFGPKAESGSYLIPGKMHGEPEQVNWNCATFAWNSFAFSTGIDLDANGGRWVYPNDIIRCRQFDQPEGRIRF